MREDRQTGVGFVTVKIRGCRQIRGRLGVVTRMRQIEEFGPELILPDVLTESDISRAYGMVTDADSLRALRAECARWRAAHPREMSDSAFWVLHAHQMSTFNLGDHTNASALADEMVRLTEIRGHPRWRSIAHLVRASTDFSRGRSAASMSDLALGVALLDREYGRRSWREPGWAERLDGLHLMGATMTYAAVALLGLNLDVQLRVWIDRMSSPDAVAQPATRNIGELIRGWYHFYAGCGKSALRERVDAARCFALASAAFRRAADGPCGRPAMVPDDIRALEAAAAALAGSPSDETILDRHRHGPPGTSTTVVNLAWARIASARGDHHRAIAAVDRAVECNTGLDARPELHWVLLIAAADLRRRGRAPNESEKASDRAVAALIGQHQTENAARAQAFDRSLAEARERLDVERQRAALHTDPLTGLGNRRCLDTQLAAARASDDDRALFVAFLDVDNFKLLNDAHSHLYGDRVLRTIGACIRAIIGEGERGIRYGGDEFVLILNAMEESGLVARLARLQSCIAETTAALIPEHGPVSVSVGIAHLGDNATTDAFLFAADRAMLDVKRTGGGAIGVAALGSPPV